MRTICAIRERKRWSDCFGFSIAQGSNINSDSDAEVIEIFGLSFHPNERANRRSRLGVSIWGGGACRQPLRGRVHLSTGLDMSVINYK